MNSGWICWPLWLLRAKSGSARRTDTALTWATNVVDTDLFVTRPLQSQQLFNLWANHHLTYSQAGCLSLSLSFLHEVPRSSLCTCAGLNLPPERLSSDPQPVCACLPVTSHSAALEEMLQQHQWAGLTLRPQQQHSPQKDTEQQKE